MEMSPIEEFYDLARRAEEALMSETTYGVPDIEPFCLRIVELARTHPEAQAELVEGFKRVVDEPDVGAWEIIMLCMHLLRWPEIKEWAELSHANCIKQNDWRGEPVYRHIIEAFSENWGHREMYESLRAGQ